MKRGKLYLIDWDAAHAAERARMLEEEGWAVRIESEDGARACKHMAEDPPDVLVVDLKRLPSIGSETARATRSLKQLRELPVVFLDDEGTGNVKAAGAVPGATFTTSAELIYVLARGTLHSAD